MSKPGDRQPRTSQGLSRGQRRGLVVVLCVAPLGLVLFVGGGVSTLHDMHGSLTTYLGSGPKGGPAWLWLAAFALGSAVVMVSVVSAVSALVRDSRNRRVTNAIE